MDSTVLGKHASDTAISDLQEIKKPKKQKKRNSSTLPSLTGVDIRGVHFVTQMEATSGVSFIPSTKNFFGGVKVRKMKLDTGCSTILLPLKSSKQLLEIKEKFSLEKYTFSIGNSDTVGGKCPVMLIKGLLSKTTFEAIICKDLIGSDLPLHLSFLRFCLCTADMKFIIDNSEDKTQPLYGCFQALEISRLKSHLEKNPELGRRHYGLLGLNILRHCGCIRSSTIGFYVDVSVHQTRSWLQVAKDTAVVTAQLRDTALFEDLEDADPKWQDRRTAMDDEDVFVVV